MLLEMNTYIATQVDRSFLYLMAIYAIHGILLHVFLMQPQLGSAKMNRNIVAIHISYGWKSSIIKGNWSDTIPEYNIKNEKLIVTNKLLHQPKLTGCAIRYSLLSKPNSSSSCAVTMSHGCTMFENMSPAVLGIILGCVVFFLTFTDNKNIS